MITVEQIKAARALLNWNQQDLADAAHMSKPALANLERRTVKPRLKTLEAIKSALEIRGIVFIEGPGVELRADQINVQVWDGGDGLSRIFTDMLSTLEENDVRIIVGVSEEQFKKVAGDRFDKFLNKVGKRGIRALIFSEEGDDDYYDYTANYRWVPAKYFSTTTTYVYADRYAILLWEPYPKVIMIQNQSIADRYRAHYLQLWKEAKMPSDYKDNFDLKDTKLAHLV